MITRVFAAITIAAVVFVPASALAKQHRSAAAIYQFKKQTGYLDGRPGYIIDHVVPLCAGGADDPSNMQWQTIEEANKKDRLERLECRSKRINR